MIQLIIQQQQAGLGFIGWFVVMMAFFFIKNALSNKKEK